MAKKKYTYVSKSFTYEGVRYYVKGKTEREAQRKKAEKLAALMSGETGITSMMTLEAWSETWLDTYIRPKIRPAGEDKGKGTMTAKTAAQYELVLREHINPALGKLKLSAVKDTHLQNFLNSKSDYSHAYVQRMKQVIKAMFRRAYQSRLIDFDPSTGLELPALKKGQRRSLTEYEREIFQKVAGYHKDGTLFNLILNTGLRPAEVCALKVRNIDFKENLIEVIESIESGTKTVSMPKSKAGKRFVFIPVGFVDDLKAHVENKKPDEFVFSQEDGKSMITVPLINKYWTSFSRAMDLEMGAECNSYGHIYDPKDLLPDGKPMYPDKDGKPKNGHKIAPDLVPYCLRHTYCTDLMREGVGLESVRYLMGHENITTTANIYTHSDKREAIAAGKKIVENAAKRGKNVET